MRRATCLERALLLVAGSSSEASVQLNRAAMQSPELAQLLLQLGRYWVGPLVEEYLARLHEKGRYRFPDPAAAFRLLYGLVIEDIQIRVLLGEKPSSKKYIAKHADVAVKRFLTLTQT